MDPTASSLLSSLSQLTTVSRNRAREESERQLRSQQRDRVASLVAENRRRRVERQRLEHERRRRDQERQRRLEEDARRRGRDAAEAELAAIAAKHEARMREMALVHDLEEQRMAATHDHRKARMGAFAVVSALIWIGTIVLFANQPPAGHFASSHNIPAPVVAELAPSPGSLPSAAAEVAEVVEPIATARSQPTTHTPRRYPTPRAPTRPAPEPVTTSSPAPAPTCDDTSGDPCCAFGEIVC